MDHRCIHEEEIILLKDHDRDMGGDVKKILRLLQGNGSIGIITRQELHEQSLKRLWAVVKYGAGSFATIAAVVTVLIKALGE